jgi:DNA-binding response OmpR family regulator
MARIYTILVIEDEKMMGNAITAALSGRGHDVRLASNDDDGRKRLGQAQFDLVINDPLVPVPGGSGTVLALDDQLQRPRVLATSGLRTPFSADELLDAVDRALA